MKRMLIALCILSVGPIASAQIPTGTWVRRGNDGIPPLLMIVESAGSGLKITYMVLGADGKPLEQSIMTVATALDGKEAPVMLNGKPSGETMATREVDNHHMFTVLKMDGKPFGTSKLEISADGKTLKVENDITFAAYNQRVGKQMEYWDKR